MRAIKAEANTWYSRIAQRVMAFIQSQTGGVCDTCDGALLSPFFDGFGQLVMVYMGREVKTIWAESKEAQARGRLVC